MEPCWPCKKRNRPDPGRFLATTGRTALRSASRLGADDVAEQFPLAALELHHLELLDRGKVGRAGRDLDAGAYPPQNPSGSPPASSRFPASGRRRIASAPA